MKVYQPKRKPQGRKERQWNQPLLCRKRAKGSVRELKPAENQDLPSPEKYRMET